MAWLEASRLAAPTPSSTARAIIRCRTGASTVVRGDSTERSPTRSSTVPATMQPPTWADRMASRK